MATLRSPLVLVLSASLLIGSVAVGAARLTSTATMPAATGEVAGTETFDPEALEGGLTEAERDGEERPSPLDPAGARAVTAPRFARVPAFALNADLRTLPVERPIRHEEREENGAPANDPITEAGAAGTGGTPLAAGTLAAAPGPTSVIDGLNYGSWGCGFPPDTNGDVGPNHYIQSVNCSFGIFDKTTGSRLAANTFNGITPNTSGTVCDSNNYGDPVVVYDTFADRWIMTDFAFTMSGGNMTSQTYQCVLVSKTSNPVTGGWWYYAIPVTDASSIGDIGDYPKVGVWPDGIYITYNVFSSAGFKNVRLVALNRADLESGAALRTVLVDLPQSVGGTTVFSALPSNARVQTGTPAVGAPNLIASIWGKYAIRVWKWSIDWSASPIASSVTGPSEAPTGSWSVGPGQASTPNNGADTLSYRLMMQNQYTKIGGTESIWLSHTVANPSSTGLAAPRWYQLGVTGGTIASSVTQAGTWNPDTTYHRFTPSLAVDRLGDMAMGFSVSNASTYPQIRYAARLAGDPLGTLAQGEALLYAGSGAQTYSNRWGDYSAMSLDPDGCTFWFTTEAYDAVGYDWRTKIASFSLPGCTGPVTPPAAPRNLAATLVGSSASLTWTDDATSETGYRVERSSGSGFVAVASLAAGATSWTDSGLSASTTYTYRVVATNSGGSSDPSNLASIVTPPALLAPSNLSATPLGQTSVSLTWTDNAGIGSGYSVERATSLTGTWTLLTQTANGNGYTVTGLRKNTTYYFRIRALGAFPSGYVTVSSRTLR